MCTQIISYEEGIRRLSVREINVLDVVEIGLTNKEIADELNLSIRTNSVLNVSGVQ
ncbi:MAG: LuxR C-terminal-related transcriptional regulator [Balneolaceae bacterium]